IWVVLPLIWYPFFIISASSDIRGVVWGFLHPPCPHFLPFEEKTGFIFEFVLEFLETLFSEILLRPEVVCVRFDPDSICSALKIKIVIIDSTFPSGKNSFAEYHSRSFTRTRFSVVCNFKPVVEEVFDEFLYFFAVFGDRLAYHISVQFTRRKVEVEEFTKHFVRFNYLIVPFLLGRDGHLLFLPLGVFLLTISLYYQVKEK